MNIDELNNLSDRLNFALKLTHTRKADLARAIDVAPQVIQFLCSSKTQASRFTFEIATALGLNTRWLATGEGEMFIADDPQKALKNYSRIPFLQPDQYKNFFILNTPIKENEIVDWYPLKTDAKNIVAIQMPDSSMAPNIPLHAILFIDNIKNTESYEDSYVFSYITKFDTFAIRKLIKQGTSFYLAPINNELFKEILVNNDVIMLGIITDCFWHIRS